MKRGKIKKEVKKSFNSNIIYFGVSGLLLVLLIGYGIYSFLIPRVDSVAISEAGLLEGDGDSLSIDLGETSKLSCVYKGKNLSNYKIEWISDNPSIVSVDKDGKITSVGAGKAIVSCKVKNKKGDIPVEVIDVNDTSNAESASYRLTIKKESSDKAKNLRYLFMFPGEKATTYLINSNNKSVFKNASISIKDTSIATIDKNGVITASTKIGETMLTVKIKGETIKVPIIVRKKNTSNIHALQVGGALATVFESKNGNFGMYDTGRHNVNKYDTCIKIDHYLKGLGVKDLQFIVLSHLHGDHYGCLKKLLKSYSVKKLYIKDYPKSNWNSSKASIELVKEFKEVADAHETEVMHVTVKDNSSIELDEMKFELFNKEEVFSKFIPNNGEGCNQTAKHKKKGLDTLCSENANSLAMLLHVDGTKRTSWNYFAGDIENQGIAGTKITVNGNVIKQVFGSFGKWYVKGYKGNINKKLYREDKTACTVRNYIAEKNGDSVIDDCYESSYNMRKYIKDNKMINTSNRVNIDVYQISHHGLNNSLTVYSYLFPKYAYISNGERALTKKKYVGKTAKVGQTMYWPTFVGMNYDNVMITGKGTIIYSIDESGNMSIPLQMASVKKFDFGDDDIIN